MTQAKESLDVKGFRECYALFDTLVGHLENASVRYAANGGSLDESVKASIGTLRANGLPVLAQMVADYASYSTVPHESPESGKALEGKLNALEAFSEITWALNIGLAEAYAAMPPEAKALVTLSTTFENLVERKPVYQSLLMKSGSHAVNPASLTNLLNK